MKTSIKLIAVFVVLCTLLPNIAISQKDLTINDAVMGRWGDLAPERLSNLNWIPETNTYCYSETTDNGAILVMVDAQSFAKTEIISASELGAQMKVKKAMKRIPTFHWLNANEAYFIWTRVVYLYNVKSKTTEQLYALPKGSANFEFRPNSADMAFTRDNNLYVIIDGEETAVTEFTDPNIVAGQTVSRVEFGIQHGVVWSKSGNKLAFYQKDETEVTNYPLVNYNTTPAELKSIKYPMAGMGSETVKVGLYSLGSSAVTYLKTEGPKDQYLTALSWGPKEKFVYVGHLNRDQNAFNMKQYNAKSGELITSIFTEEDKEYVHPMHSLKFIGKEDFLWISEKSGINQFYNYNVTGKANWHINTGDILVRSYVGYDPESRKLWFLGNHKDGIDQHLFEVVITDGGNENVKQITNGDTYHSSILLSSNGKYGIIKSSSVNTSSSYDLVEFTNYSISNIFTSKNPLADYKIGETKMDTILAADNSTLLHSRTIFPYDFDETKKYPVLVYVYNGPGVQLLHSSWLGGASLWMYHFANKGYIIYTIDGRGSANRGIEFEQSIFRNLGQVEMKDQLVGVDYLKTQTYVDSTRFAVHGWSYGGFMTTSLMTSYPGVFKVGAAGGPVMDWKYYEVMYCERYMDTPETNKEGYELTSNVLRAKDLEGKLLIIHGTADPTVVKQHSDMFLNSCISNGVQVDYFEYPGHEHNVYGKDRVHLMTKILDYIEAYL